MALQWLKRLLGSPASKTKAPATVRRHPHLKPRLEQLEDRITPVTGVTDLTTMGMTATTLVQQLVGTGVQISNIQFQGINLSAGTFTGGLNTVGFDTGVVLSSGEARDVIGTGGYTGTFASTDVGGLGDAQLDAIVSPQLTQDATVLEFDFIPDGSQLTFQYVFSSEEYPDFVGSPFNDVFAFFLNGQNVALIPGTNTPVSINTVNNGDLFGFFPPTNPQFFVDNYTTAARAISLGGLTVVLDVKATVNSGVPNHIKLAIADASDGILDSDVFIKSGSFSAPRNPLMKVFNPMRLIFNKKTNQYSGQLTLVNIGTDAQPGPVYVIFKKLPQGVKLLGAQLTATGKPFLTLNVAEIGINKTVFLNIKLKNPLKLGLNSYFKTANLQFTAVDPS